MHKDTKKRSRLGHILVFLALEIRLTLLWAQGTFLGISKTGHGPRTKKKSDLNFALFSSVDHFFPFAFGFRLNGHKAHV